ncbi:MAG: hypothetical protein IJL87_02420 [Clostridia bacterium]|nr:hypothetical protein [Clostridia bacterium]
MNLKRITAVLSAAVLLVVMLASCKPTPASTPEEAVEMFLKYFSAAKYKNAFNYVDEYDGFSFDDRNSKDAKKIAKAVSKSMSYEVVGKTENENPVEVIAKVTCVDLTQIYKTCTEQVVSSMFKDILGGKALESDDFKSALNQAVIKAISDKNAPVCTNEVTFKLTNNEGSWFVIMDDHTLDLVCGNIITANAWLEDRLASGEQAGGQIEEGTEQDEAGETAAESSAESAAETTGN